MSGFCNFLFNKNCVDAVNAAGSWTADVIGGALGATANFAGKLVFNTVHAVFIIIPKSAGDVVTDTAKFAKCSFNSECRSNIKFSWSETASCVVFLGVSAGFLAAAVNNFVNAYNFCKNRDVLKSYEARVDLSEDKQVDLKKVSTVVTEIINSNQGNVKGFNFKMLKIDRNIQKALTSVGWGLLCLASSVATLWAMNNVSPMMQSGINPEPTE